MVSAKRTYSLSVLFDKDRTSCEKVLGLLSRALQSQHVEISQRLTIQCAPDQAGYPVLSVSGSLEDVDACHGLIAKYLVRGCQLNVVRLIDEVGLHTRTEAYPIIASVELGLRAFVDHAGASLMGFATWGLRVDFFFARNRIDTARLQTGETDLWLTRLECVQFGDLINLVTWEASDWERSRPLTAGDLLELLQDTVSPLDLVCRLNDRFAQSSVWLQVFGHMIDQKEWDRIKRNLSFIEQVRHHVMHQRPMRRRFSKSCAPRPARSRASSRPR